MENVDCKFSKTTTASLKRGITRWNNLNNCWFLKLPIIRHRLKPKNLRITGRTGSLCRCSPTKVHCSSKLVAIEILYINPADVATFSHKIFTKPSKYKKYFYVVVAVAHGGSLMHACRKQHIQPLHTRTHF